MKPISPLLPWEEVVVEKCFTVDDIIQRYLKYLRVDVRDDLREVEEILLCRGRKSNLRFFWPRSLAGNGSFYEKLMPNAHYYLEEKWEYNEAVKLLPPHQQVLEIGCGSGDFLKKLLALGHTGVGLEINQKAIRLARDKGLDVTLGTIEKYAESSSREFDVVCAFQVLEHLSDPLAFLRSSLQCLRPGGLLIFAVPNGDGVFASLDVALDMPPHHMLRWNGAAFQFLSQLLPVDLYDLRNEPISRLHVGMMSTAFLNHLSLPQSGWAAFRRKVVSVMASKYMSFFYDELVVSGHTLLAAFRKRESEPQQPKSP
jgi:2-polyprenyl-3-methyl-5-hydroxy-6-metoxy-1,4-benzoquinol methylase